MIIFNHLRYLRLNVSPTFAAACLEAEAGQVVPQTLTDWAQKARCRLLAVMKYWEPAIRVNHSAQMEEALQTSVRMLLLAGSCSMNLDDVVNRCINNTDGPEGETIPRHVNRLRYSVCYLAYGLKNSQDQLSHITMYADECLGSLPPTSCRCLDCGETVPYAEFEGQRMHSSQMRRSSAGPRWLCAECISNNWVWSSMMGEYLADDDELVYPQFSDGPVSRRYAESNFHVEEDEDTGEETWHREAPRDAGLRNYSANPFDTNRWDTRNSQNALVFGVELEMEPRAGHSQRSLISLLGGSCKQGSNYILKSDGSLTDGVELVTMPFTLEQHKEEKAIKWNKLLNAVNKGAAKSGDGTTHCGMHVHINKAALSALTIGKMLVFLNSEGLSPLISTIAQRGSSNYCTRDTNKKVTDGARQGQNRYDIMNVSVSHPTCEVRMFRGNLRPERVFKNIEFCHALVQYARQTSLQDLSDWGNFTRWLTSKRGQYPYLVQFLIDKAAVGFRQLERESNEHYSPVAIEEV